MQRLGWTAVAAVWRGEPQHVIEYCGARAGDAGNFAKTFAAKYRLNSCAQQSGADFWKRTSRYLYDLGLREDVGPRRGEA